MSIVISNSSLMMRINFSASIEPSPLGSPPRATNASRVSSSLVRLWFFFCSAMTRLNYAYVILPVFSESASAIIRKISSSVVFYPIISNTILNSLASIYPEESLSNALKASQHFASSSLVKSSSFSYASSPDPSLSSDICI